MKTVIERWTDKASLPVLIIMAVGIIPVAILIFTLLWNAVIPGMTGWHDIDYIDAVLIIIIAKSLQD